MKLLAHIILFIVLTIITQVGGIVLLLALWLANVISLRFKAKKLILFTGLYMLATFLIVPLLAPQFGRERVKNTSQIKPANWGYVGLNRNYVVPAMNDLLQESAENLPKEIGIKYLDANFPFLNKFPLLPHLSHNDGRKIDIAFMYESPDGNLSQKKKSISGYGYFVAPKSSEYNQTEVCKSKGYWQYDGTRFAHFGKVNKNLQFSEAGTKTLINSFLQQKSTGKIFIEPHLKTRLRLNDSRIRFHGCRAVRHDDHIHLQL